MRTSIAGVLLTAREAGVGWAILFTGEDNVPAQRAYRNLGFDPAGADATTLCSG